MNHQEVAKISLTRPSEISTTCTQTVRLGVAAIPELAATWAGALAAGGGIALASSAVGE